MGEVLSDQIETYVDRAVRWAMGLLGSTEYRYLCLGFVEDAYEMPNGIELDGYSYAKESADAYGAERNTGVPPRGAYVLYDCWGEIKGERKNWGHVGLSLGDGKVVHAWDKVRVDGYLEVQNLAAGPGWTRPQYVGWAPVSQVFEGATIRTLRAHQRKLVEAWRREEQQPFSGWDFSYLTGRMLEEEHPWSYPARAAELMQQSSAVLDMGTGGGERLLELRAYWPKKVAVTEDYPPNLELVTKRLAPLGVRVENVSLTIYDPMPFADGEFDLVLNRHSGFNAGEVARILAPGGTFLTQQVHGLWAQDLLAVFGAKPQWPEATLYNNADILKAAGLTIVRAEDWSGKLTFTDVGAIAYYLKAVPWLVPGFAVDTHLECLLELQARLERGEGLAFEAGKYLIEACR